MNTQQAVCHNGRVYARGKFSDHLTYGQENKLICIMKCL